MGKRLVGLMLVMALCLGLMAPLALAGTPTSHVVLPSTMGGLNLRAGAGTNYKVVGWAVNGDEIDLVKVGSRWTRVTVLRSGKTGYIKNNYIKDLPDSGSDTPVKPSTAEAGRVTGRSVNLRAGAGTSYKTVGSAAAGTKLKIWTSKGNWYYVTTLAGKTGWISKTYVAKGFTSITSAKLNLRKTPNGALIRTLAKGAKVSVISMSGSWSKVKAGSNTGYCYTKYLK